MKRLLCIFCILFPLSVFADNVCPAGFTVRENMPEEYAILPAGYTRLEYIESTGTQWMFIYTMETSDIDYEIDFMFDNLQSTNNFVGVLGYNMNYQLCIVRATSEWSIGNANSGVIALSNHKYHANGIISNTASNTTYYIDNQLINVQRAMGYNTPIHLFTTSTLQEAESSINYNMSGKIYHCVLKNHSTGNKLIDLNPAKRNSDNVVGMYDTISGQFFTNAGTGTFIAGPEKKYNIINVDNTDCFACPYNTYKPNAGNEDCTHCPTGTFSPIGSTSLSDCAKILHVGGYIAYMPVGRRTEHGLCTMFDGKKYCADVYERQ